PIYLEQPNRPEGMGYFDFVISEIHGLRVKELLDHKAKGGKVFGTFCLYVPDEVITALGGISVGLCAGTDFSEADAELDLPRNLCPLIKSFYGFKKGRICPYFEATDLVVGETTCDGKTKAYEHLGAMHPVYVMEVPHRKNDDTRKLWRAELYKFIAEAERLTGKKLTYEKLRENVRLHNAKRRALQRLNALRWKNPVPISGKDALLVNQIAFYDDPVRFTASVEKLVAELEQRVRDGVGVFPKDAPRLMTSGTPFAIPNWKLHHVIETGGWPVVAEESCVGSRYFSGTVDEPSEPSVASYAPGKPSYAPGESPGDLGGLLDAVARRFFDIHCACFTPNAERMDDIVDLCRKSGAKGVVNYTLSFCTPYLVEARHVENRLKKEGIPVLNLDSDYGMGDFGQLQTRIGAFVESL
ncbi:MAG TPA: 2-hydroxyacyl-CoA dehydratase, partial [Candidatus Coatesbacteria bacterium]|nr:2-hydroxyacyl-CoA dehydratase [Candidatus Coatesbacteria bacterium]